MIGAQSDSIGTGARGSEPNAGDKSGGPVTQISLEVESVFGSNANECAAFEVGSIHRPRMARSAPDPRPERLQVQFPEYGPMTDLSHVHRRDRERLPWSRIHRSSSLHGCPRHSSSSQIRPDGQGHSCRSAPDGQASWPVVRSRRIGRSVREKNFTLDGVVVDD